MSEPTPAEVLDLALPDNDADAPTVRDYLVSLLAEVWENGEGFSGKRPFGNSSWEYELYGPMVHAGMVTGTFDRYGCLDDFDEATARRLIAAAITSLRGVPA